MKFSKYHPIVNFLFFGFVIVYSMLFMNILALLVSFLTVFVYSKKIGNKVLYTLPIFVITSIINPLFSHQGVTILAYFPNGNPLTKESIIYGFSMGLMIVNVILLFGIYNKTVSNDKFMYLFSKIIPSLSLIISMVLRFVPKFKKQMKSVMESRKMLGFESEKFIDKIKNATAVISIMITWSLEDSIDTAKSMKSRGYGLLGRTAYNNFYMSTRDYFATFYIVILAFIVGICAILGFFEYKYFPMFELQIGLKNIIALVMYLLLCSTPIFMELERRENGNN